MAQLDRLKLQLGLNGSTDEDEVLTELLESAKAAILSKRFPFTTPPAELESRYLDLQIRIAVFLYNKLGAEGQTAHSENGISRTYATDGIPLSMLSEVVPYVGVPRGGSA